MEGNCHGLFLYTIAAFASYLWEHSQLILYSHCSVRGLVATGVRRKRETEDAGHRRNRARRKERAVLAYEQWHADPNDTLTEQVTRLFRTFCVLPDQRWITSDAVTVSKNVNRLHLAYSHRPLAVEAASLLMNALAEFSCCYLGKV